MITKHKKLNLIACLVFSAYLFFLFNTQSLAITWCHDYTLWEVTKSDQNQVKADQLRSALSGKKYQIEFTVPPGSSDLPEKLKCGDIIIIGSAHSGVVNSSLGIDSYLQPIVIGGGIDPVVQYKPSRIKSLNNFERNWSVRKIRNYKREIIEEKVETGVKYWKFWTDEIWVRKWTETRTQYPYRDDVLEVWRKPFIDQEKILEQANELVEKCSLDINSLIQPILKNKDQNLDICPKKDLSAEAKALLNKAKALKDSLEKTKDIIKEGVDAHKKATSAATSAQTSKDKIQAANNTAIDIIAKLKGKLPNRDSANTMCTDAIALAEEMNKYIELATKFEADTTPFHKGTEEAKKKVCVEIKAMAEASPEGPNETMVKEATNIANRANINSQNAKDSAQKSRENFDLAGAASNRLKIKLDGMESILKEIAAFKKISAEIPSIDEADQELVNAESEAGNAQTAAYDALNIEGKVATSHYVETCFIHANAADLISQAHGEAVAAGDEQDKAENSVESARTALESLNEKLNEIKELEKLATEIEGIIQSCALPEQSPLEGAEASADRAQTLAGLAHNNWTEAEICASHIREPRVAEDEEDGEASEDVPNVLAEGEVSEDEGEPSDETTAENEDTSEEELSDGVPGELAEGETVEAPDEETPDIEEEGVLDEWAGPWMGTLKAEVIKVNGVKKSSSQIISELDQNYLKKKKKREKEKERERQREREEEEAEGPSLGRALEGVQEIPEAIGEAIFEAIAEMIDLIFIAIVDVSSNGIPVGFGLKKLESGYRVYIPGMPAKDAKNLKSIPIFALAEDGTLQGKFTNPNGFGSVDIDLVPNEDKSGIHVTVVLLAKNIKGQMPDAKYNSIEIVLKGSLKREEFTYPVLAEQLKNRIGPVVKKHIKRLNPETED